VVVTPCAGGSYRDSTEVAFELVGRLTTVRPPP
jgi:phosphoheptose isomerase